jgi:hypothetical protein
VEAAPRSGAARHVAAPGSDECGFLSIPNRLVGTGSGALVGSQSQTASHRLLKRRGPPDACFKDSPYWQHVLRDGIEVIARRPRRSTEHYCSADTSRITLFT